MAGFYRAMTWTTIEAPSVTLDRCSTLALQYEGAGPLHYEVPIWFDADAYEGIEVSLEELGIELTMYDERTWREAVATRTSMTSAFELWSPQRFRGLGLDFVVPTRPTGPRTIVGSLWWEIRRTSDTNYLHHVAVQYPFRSQDENADLEQVALEASPAPGCDIRRLKHAGRRRSA